MPGRSPLPFLPAAMDAFEKVARRAPPTHVHHYTTAAGLLGILHSERIWATSARYVNDASELLYGRDVVCDVLRDTVAGQQAAARQWLAPFLDMLERLFDQHDLYIACFCESSDLLSQWRAYGAQGGYALGFKSARLSDLGAATIFRVEYAPAVQKESIRETLALHLAEFDVAHKKKDSARIVDVSGSLGLLLALWIAAFKHPSFAEEQEWRVMPLKAPEAVLIRNDSGWLRPYVEVPLVGVGKNVGAMPLTRITHGPSQHPDLAKRSLRLLLANTKYAEIAIAGSDVPLRT